MKKRLKALLVAILGWQVRRLRAKNDFTVVAVVGSIGKTSTKFAIARMLSAGKKVQWQEGNYNDHVSVPLVFFGRSMPNILNPIAWLHIVITNEVRLHRRYPYEVVVVELGTDGPGQIAGFRKYLNVNIAVVTAIAPEHMESFDSIDAVAAEELSVQGFSDKLIINSDLTDARFTESVTKPIVTVGTKDADVQATTIKLGKNSTVNLQKNGSQWLKLEGSFYSKAEVYSLVLAAAVADKIGLSKEQIKQASTTLSPVSGRMKRLAGVNNSLIIDDTYNASPDATIAALSVLYAEKAQHKIALLGNMNELGDFAEAEHTRVGQYCDPKKLDLVVTLGPDANKYLAATAETNGCEVKRFNSPYELGAYVKQQLKDKTVVLAKGSQNNVYMEEAVKILLADPKDSSKLVRQSKSWQKIKAKNFKHG